MTNISGIIDMTSILNKSKTDYSELNIIATEMI
jgi:hypothetical protein